MLMRGAAEADVSSAGGLVAATSVRAAVALVGVGVGAGGACGAVARALGVGAIAGLRAVGRLDARGVCAPGGATDVVRCDSAAGSGTTVLDASTERAGSVRSPEPAGFVSVGWAGRARSASIGVVVGAGYRRNTTTAAFARPTPPSAHGHHRRRGVGGGGAWTVSTVGTTRG